MKTILTILLLFAFTAHADLTPYVGSGQVDSVNSHTGVVVVGSDDIAEGVTNLWYTDARAKAAAVLNTLAGSQTTQAGSVAAVNIALALKQTSAYTPGVSGNWTTAPTTVVGALDQIATGKFSTQGLQLATAGSQPTCAVGVRGLLWNIQGGAGVADVLQVCQKNASDVYAWVTK